jgi:hypothetical protein
MSCTKSLHPYQYGLSNPVSLTDPSGRDPVNITFQEGRRIHRMIQDDFLMWSLKWPGYQLGDVDTEVEFHAVSKHNAQGNPVEFDLYEFERLFLLIPDSAPTGNPGYIDIVDYKAREIYEIKSVKSALRGRKELLWYLTALNTRLP